MALTPAIIQSVNENAFKGTDSVFWSCKSGTEDSGITIAQEWVNKTGGTARAADGRTDYHFINAKVTDIPDEQMPDKLKYLPDEGLRFVYLREREQARAYSRELTGEKRYTKPYPAFRIPLLDKGAKWRTFRKN